VIKQMSQIVAYRQVVPLIYKEKMGRGVMLSGVEVVQCFEYGVVCVIHM
jgi:hypothetical protein